MGRRRSAFDRPALDRLAAIALVVLAIVALEPLAGATPASAQGRITGRYGDWQMRCEPEVGAPTEPCALIQNVEAADRANIALTVLVLRTADRQIRILRVLAPLGVLLPTGLGLSIDDTEVGLAAFVRCLRSGCIAEVPFDGGLIERFEAGSTATFVIFQTPEEGIGIPISLNGFAEGLAALDNPPTATLEAAPPREPVETETEDVEATEPFRNVAFEPADERTRLDMLLEDELFPYVAGAGGGVVLLLALVGLLLGRRSGKRKAALRAKKDGLVTMAGIAATAPPIAPATAAMAAADAASHHAEHGGADGRRQPRLGGGAERTGPERDGAGPDRPQDRAYVAGHPAHGQPAQGQSLQVQGGPARPARLPGAPGAAPRGPVAPRPPRPS